MSEELMKQKRDSIASTFYNTLFDILVETPEMTATQALIRSQEKGALLAPVASRQENEFLNVIIIREAQILQDAGAAPTPPDALLQYGGGVRVVYDSPLIKAQKSEEGAGILRTIDAATQMQPLDPTVTARLNFSTAIQRLARIYSAPAEIIRTDDEYNQFIQQENERIQSQQQAQMALGATQGVKNLAQAQAATTRNQPQQAA
jgi:hypothetical protein